MDGRIGVVAVQLRAAAFLGKITVAVGVGAGDASRVAVTIAVSAVHGAVAVVVRHVVAVFRRAGVDGRIGVIAVRFPVTGFFGVITVAVGIGADQTGLICSAVIVSAVHGPVAVVVQLIGAIFRRAGMDGRIGVIAVHGGIAALFGVIAVAIGVGAGDAGCVTVTVAVSAVHGPVAVVVQLISTIFRRAGMDGRIGVITVHGGITALFGVIAVAVAVGAGDAGCVAVTVAVSAVHGAVAVVVQLIGAIFRRAGMDGRIGVIAVHGGIAALFGVIAVAIGIGAGRAGAVAPEHFPYIGIGHGDALVVAAADVAVHTDAVVHGVHLRHRRKVVPGGKRDVAGGPVARGAFLIEYLFGGIHVYGGRPQPRRKGDGGGKTKNRGEKQMSTNSFAWHDSLPFLYFFSFFSRSMTDSTFTPLTWFRP